MTLPLHIFEARYLKMVRACLAAQTPFGVVLIKSGREVGAPAIPHRIGTMARISRAEGLPDGRLNIEAVGQERFQVLSHQIEPDGYLTADVAAFPLRDDDHATAQSAARALGPWFSQYLELLGQAAATQLDTKPLPEDPMTLAYLAAIVAQIPMLEKQALLAVPTLVELLHRERVMYRREISLLRAMLATSRAHTQATFSPN